MDNCTWVTPVWGTQLLRMVVDGPDNAHVLDNGVHKAYTKTVVYREVIS
jgi:hypothetical protein